MAQPITHDDLGKGLDGLRSEHKVADGYWLTSTNLDPTLAGSVSKRTGYGLFAGLVPLRVRSLSRSTTTLTITLPSWVDATQFRSRRILLYGRATAAIGGITTTNAAYVKVATPGSGHTITVPCTDSGATSDTTPQLVVFGLDTSRFSAIASDAGSRPGWIHHLDTFTDSVTAKQWPVCAMGGNFFAGRDNEDLDSSLQLTRSAYVRFPHDTADRVIGPAFWHPSDSPALTRGFLTHAEAGANEVPITSIAWVSGTTAAFTVDGTVSIGSGSLSTILAAGLDHLSVEQAPHSIFNGQFRIVDSSLNSGVLTIQCEVPGLEDDRFDVSGCRAFAGVWTDVVVAASGSLPFVPADVVQADEASRLSFADSAVVTGTPGSVSVGNAWEDNQEVVFRVDSGTAPTGLTDGQHYWIQRVSDSSLELRDSFNGSAVAISAAGSGSFSLRVPSNQERWVTLSCVGRSMSIDGVVRRAVVQANRVVTGSHTGRVSIVRAVNGSTPAVLSLVEGDVVTLSDSDYRPKVVTALADGDLAISSIVGDGTTATATIADTTTLSAGDRILIKGSQYYSGEIQIDEISSSTEFTFASTRTDSDSTSGMAIAGSTVSTDFETDWTDDASESTTTGISMYRRWQPIEFVDSPNTTLISFNTVQHLDMNDDDEQPFVHSAMSADSMYFTNGSDEPMKYDGYNLFRAGLPPQETVVLGGTTRVAHPTQCISSLDEAGAHVTGSDASGTVTLSPASATKGYPPGSSILGSTSASTYPFTDYEIQGTVLGNQEATEESLGVRGSLKSYLSSIPSLPGRIFLSSIAGYYTSLFHSDRRKRSTASAGTQAEDQVYRFGSLAQGQLKLVRPPAWPGLDHSNLEISVFRRPLSGAPLFKRIRRILTDWTTSAYYYTLKDSMADFDPTTSAVDDDDIRKALVGDELSRGWEFPPRASLISAASGRALLADIKSYPTWSIVVSQNPDYGDVGTDLTHLSGIVFSFKRAGVTSGTANNTTIMEFQLVDGRSENNRRDLCRIEPIDANTFDIYREHVNGFPTFSAGDWIYLAHGVLDPTLGEPASRILHTNQTYLDFTGWYQVQAQPAGNRLTVTGASKATFTISSVTTGVGSTITFSTAHRIPIGTTTPITLYRAASLPAPLTERRTFYFKATTSTAGELYYDPRLVNQVTLTTATTGGTAFFSAPYHSGNPDTPTASSTSTVLSIFFAGTSNKKRVPIILPGNTFSDELGGDSGPWVGLKTNALISRVRQSDKSASVLEWVSHAINAAQSACVQTSGFRPWLLSRAGEDFPGELNVQSPIAETDIPTLQITLPTINGVAPWTVYVNGAAISSSTLSAGEVKTLPYRLVRSYVNYPAIFDNPYAPTDSTSDSVIDVDPATGGRITAVVPFFGESVFGAALKAQVVLVAKSNAWYAVNVETREVQKLDTNGIGCDFPRSVCVTKNGVAFAHRSGLYKINRSLDLVYLGKILGRKWDAIDTSADVDTSLANATHDALRNRYQCFLPTVNDVEGAAPVHYGFVYDHTREINPAGLSASGGTEGIGSWTEYDGIPTIGWANMGIDSLFASSPQRVFARRRLGDVTDYRDDEAAISATGIYKMLNFGVIGLRKVLRALVLTFRTSASQFSTAAAWADSSRLSFRAFDDFILETQAPQDNVADESQTNIHSVRFSAPDRRGSLFGLRVTNDGVDEGFELTDATFFVDPLQEHGVREAGESDG